MIDGIAHNFRLMPALGQAALAIVGVVVASAGSLGVIWAALGLVLD